MYEPSWGLRWPGFFIYGLEISLPISSINKSVEPNAKKLFFRVFHYAHIIGYESYYAYSPYKNDGWD